MCREFGYHLMGSVTTNTELLMRQEKTMTHDAYCVLCSGRPPLIFDVAASTEKQNAFSAYAYCDCGRIYEHEFFDKVGPLNEEPLSFVARPVSKTRIQVFDAAIVDEFDGVAPVHEFDLRDDGVYCEYHDEADGYDLPGIKQDIAARNAALVAAIKARAGSYSRIRKPGHDDIK